MKRTVIIALLAGAGVTLSGPLTADAVAFARAISANDAAALQEFAKQNPQSEYASPAIILASNQNGKGADGNNGQGKGGSGPGNQGNNKAVGNAYGGG